MPSAPAQIFIEAQQHSLEIDVLVNFTEAIIEECKPHELDAGKQAVVSRAMLALVPNTITAKSLANNYRKKMGL